MLPGPVFHTELLTTARRFRYYAIRVVYGLVLLFFIGQSYQSSYWYYRSAQGQGTPSIQELARLAQDLFVTFVITQGVAVLLMTPALVAGVIAEEKRRKTLHYLLSSRLSSAEIILGKLAARLLHVGVFLAIGLPIVSLMSLFGGIDPMLIVLAAAATTTTAFFLSALAILVSTEARRPREAIALVYVLELAWLFAPSAIDPALATAGASSTFWTRVHAWLSPAIDWLARSSPFHLLVSGPTGPNTLVPALAWMMGLQVTFGSALVALAIARLRPIFRKEGDGRRWLARARRSGRLLARPACGDDPMLWKERYVSRTSLVTKVSVLVLALIACGFLAWGTYEFARPAFAELAAYGYGAGGDSYKNTYRRAEFNGFLRVVCTLLYVVWGLALVSSAASGITQEREEDTWTSLIATPLEGWEVLHAKVFGPLWQFRWIGIVMLLLCLIGLAAGAVHPFGIVFVLVETGVFLWFVAVLGTCISLHSRSSARAIMATVAILLVLNGGYLMCCIPFRPDSPLIAVGVTPFIEAVSLVSDAEVHGYFSAADRVSDKVALACFLGTFAYGIAAATLTGHMLSQFDAVVDRPRRTGLVTPSPASETETKTEDGLEGREPT